jgi:hypothetical protein
VTTLKYNYNTSIQMRCTKYLWSRYFVTTPEPGARLVLTQGLTWQIVKPATNESRKDRTT